jgi:hypothetical protein
MKYCSRCGAELVDEAVVCTKCGCAVGAPGQIVTGVSGISQKFLAGLVTLVLGVVGLIGSIIYLVAMPSGGSGWKGSVFRPEHFYSGVDIMMIAILVISIIAAIVGAIVLKSGMIKKPKKVVRIPVWLWLLRLGLLIGVGVFLVYRFIQPIMIINN